MKKRRIFVKAFPLPPKYALKPIALALGISLLTACGGGGTDVAGTGGDGGIIGTARLPNITALSPLEAKSKSGHKISATIGANGKFSLQNTKDEAYLIRTKPSNGQGDAYIYSIGHSDGKTNITRNVHPFTDLIIRNWFSTKSLNIDSEFAKAGAIKKMPTESEINAIEFEIEGIIKKVLEDYGLNNGVNLLSTPFDANGTGFDKFLNKNQVIINNNQITIIFNQNNGNTQGISVDKLTLSKDFTSDNDTPPSTPTKVRALPASNSEIVIVWEASSDDKGISGYDLYRNGSLIGSSPYPVFTDTGLSSNTNYSYEVIAIDSRGQQSTITLATAPIKLDTPDTTAPPKASALTINATGNDVHLNWTQSQIDDVSSFLIKRGAPGSANNQIAQITSTEFTDFNLPASNTAYCYRVTSVDASGNQSSPSNEVCASITDGGSNPVACVDLQNTSITTNTTLDKPCYRVKSDMYVEGAATLTLKPGVMLKFSSGKLLRVRSDGALNAVGTATQPIIFTGADKTAGSWEGITLYNSNNSKNEFKYVTVEYGGAAGANLSIDSTTHVKISNSTIRKSSSYGVKFSSDAIIDQFSKNTITANEGAPIRIHANKIHKLDKQSSYSGNVVNREYISIYNSSSITDDQTWQALNVPYKLENHSVEAILTIEAGSTLIFRQDGNFKIEDNGTLIAKGTTNKKITFTGENKTPGSWHGIQLTFSGTANELDYVNVEYAGGTTGNGNGAVSIFGTPGRLKIHNTLITDSFQYGLDTGSFDETALDMSNVSFKNNIKGAVLIDPNDIGKLDKNSDYTGNVADLISWHNGSIDDSQTIKNLGVPYHVGNHDIGAFVDIEPGTEFSFNSGGGFDIRSGGNLSAVGTTTNPILFTGRQAISGYWDGIQFFTGGLANKMDYTIVEYGGKAGTGNTDGLIGVFFNDSRVDVTNSILRHSETNGLWLYDNTSGNHSGNTFEDIIGDEVYVDNP